MCLDCFDNVAMYVRSIDDMFSNMQSRVRMDGTGTRDSGRVISPGGLFVLVGLLPFNLTAMLLFSVWD